MFLLDTNVVSEEMNRRPDPSVVAWMQRVELETAFLSVISLGEIERGIASLERRAGGPTRRSRELAEWLTLALLPRFEGRILHVTLPIARRWGRMLDEQAGKGLPPPWGDTMIAATAAQHGLTVATRNTADFQALGVPFLNPWEE
ncbi:type II toxin-antitoxin system VapC family toxin [Deinococcus sp. YIM 134068]|uniref:type II toxin-antitoxin system VapC family toxin n=1 Tax=Deinococcus lichenicola TaxID=3118910 RepID=UPI002F93ED28